MMVPAPGRLSTTTCCPQASVSFTPNIRASVSFPPPGGYGTMRRIGFVGYADAPTTKAGAAAHNGKATTRTSRTALNRMLRLLHEGEPSDSPCLRALECHKLRSTDQQSVSLD